jgi:uncharacterized Zn-binding protein involved in type VI secretion
MAKRRFIVLGDVTSHGGTVITANSRMTIDGKPVACVGDLVVCPRCSGTHVILGCGKKSTLDGREMACEGDPVSDGSYLISVGQANATHDVDDGSETVKSTAVAKRASSAPMKSATNAAGQMSEEITMESRPSICEGCLKKAARQGSFFLAV